MTNYNDGKWHGWNGGECPVHPESEVEAVYTRSEIFKGIVSDVAKAFSWEDSEYSLGLVAFRVVKEHRKPREFWITNNDGFAHDSLDSAERDPLTEKHGFIHVREVIA